MQIDVVKCVLMTCSFSFMYFDPVETIVCHEGYTFTKFFFILSIDLRIRTYMYVIMYHGNFFLLSSISALCYESNYYFSSATIYSLTMQKRQPSHLLLEYYKFKFNYLNKLKTVIRFLLKRN